jgi:MYXO-CTERM domain-containing protein
MKRIWLILAVFLGLAAAAVPASAAVVFTLNNGGSLSPTTTGNFGTVTLTSHGTGANAYVRVQVHLKTGSSFVGTGAGYAITWNIAGSPSPALQVAGDNGSGTFNNSVALASTFVLKAQGVHSYDALGGQTFSPSPFGNVGEYAIDRTTSGNSGPTVTSLVFDVTKTGGLTISDFIAKNGFFFTADIFLAGCTGNNCTGVVAASGPGTRVPEPQTWLLFVAGLVGLPLLQRRRKKASA